MRIYLDVSGLNRPYDNQAQLRVQVEANAVMTIIERKDQYSWKLVSSEMVIREINSIQEDERRRQVTLMLNNCESIIPIDEAIIDRAVELRSLGFRSADAAHVAAAEDCQADLLLTCDDKMVKLGRRYHSTLNLEIRNPASWLQEILDV